MTKEEKQPVDITEQPIVFGVVLFSASAPLFYFIKKNYLYISSFSLFVKTNRGRFMLCCFCYSLFLQNSIVCMVV